jgi:hypothetical protein
MRTRAFRTIGCMILTRIGTDWEDTPEYLGGRPMLGRS